MQSQGHNERTLILLPSCLLVYVLGCPGKQGVALIFYPCCEILTNFFFHFGYSVVSQCRKALRVSICGCFYDFWRDFIILFFSFELEVSVDFESMYNWRQAKGVQCSKADGIKGEAGTSLEAIRLKFSLSDESEGVPKGSNSQAAFSFDRSKKAVLSLEQLPTQNLIPWQSWLPPSSHTSYHRLEYCSRILVRFCFQTRKTFAWEELGMVSCSIIKAPLLWTKHLQRRESPLDCFCTFHQSS